MTSYILGRDLSLLSDGQRLVLGYQGMNITMDDFRILESNFSYINDGSYDLDLKIVCFSGSMTMEEISFKQDLLNNLTVIELLDEINKKVKGRML